MSGSIGTMTQRVMVCPACKADVNGRFSYDLTLDGELTDSGFGQVGKIPAVLNVTGVEIKHDCIPKVTR